MLKEDTKPPKSLRTKKGELKPVPAWADSVVRCPECRRRLFFSGEGWGCPVVLGHVKLIRDGLLLERLKELLDKIEGRKPNQTTVLRFLKRRQRFLTKSRLNPES